MDNTSELIIDHPAIFDVPDVEREQVYDELVKRVACSIKKRSRPKVHAELRRVLRLNEETRKAANEGEFQVWLMQLNEPLTKAGSV